MLGFSNITLRRGPRELLRGLNLTVHAGQKVGLTGANGCGKSSLFALIRGELSPDAGNISLPADIVMAHVAQETPAVTRSAIDYVMDGDRELRRVQDALTTAEQDDDGHRQAELHARLEAIGGYTARSRAARLLHGLGFGPEQTEAPVASFSGGWRMRLNLAQALMCRSDLLLLDEPTNHLDLDAVIWLQDWLAAYRGTLLLISHDRDFLDQVVDHIAHIEQGGLRLYTGNYSAFERRRAERLAQQQAACEKQQREIAHVRRFIERFRAKATRARQAQSRLKTLARMETIAPAHVDSPFHFAFEAPAKLPNPLLQLDAVRAGYGKTAVLEQVSLSLLPGDRIGLLGVNGAGKSTLVKLLAGEMEPLAGRRLPARALRAGYFAQHQLEQLRDDWSPLEHLRRLDPRAGEKALRDFLGGFAFSGDRALEPVGPFSGGERARLVLALLVFQRPNLLLLDEPTNHLDLEMRHALALALQDFEGALVVVSHDRHLLRSTTDELWLVADGGVAPFVGDLDDYRRQVLGRNRETDATPAAGRATPDHSAAGRKDRKRQEAEQRKRLQPLRKRVLELEREVGALQARKAGLDRELADPALYRQDAAERLQTLLREQAAAGQRLAALEEAWLEASEAYEAASSR